jgi:hypothetical protein
MPANCSMSLTSADWSAKTVKYMALLQRWMIDWEICWAQKDMNSFCIIGLMYVAWFEVDCAFEDYCLPLHCWILWGHSNVLWSSCLNLWPFCVAPVRKGTCFKDVVCIWKCSKGHRSRTHHPEQDCILDKEAVRDRTHRLVHAWPSCNTFLKKLSNPSNLVVSTEYFWVSDIRSWFFYALIAYL